MHNLREMIDESTLTAVLQNIFQQPVILGNWDVSSAHTGYMHSLTGGIYRLSGDVHLNDEPQQWSVILKVVLAPEPPDEMGDFEYWKREFWAYQSGFLKNIPGQLRAPTCYLAKEVSVISYHLWLEDVGDSLEAEWPLSHFKEVGQHLGQFNGAYLQKEQLPSEPWLSKNWLPHWIQQYTDIPNLIANDATWQHPLVKAHLPIETRDPLLKIWQNQNILLKALAALPQTVLHLDAYRPNLIAQQSNTVLLDWDKIGYGAIGEELGGVVPASMIWFRVNANDAVEFGNMLFEGYVLGLREAGWQGDKQLVRLGFTASSVLRWLIPGLFWLRGTVDADYVEKWSAWWQRPLHEMQPQWVKVTQYLLDLAHEAYELSHVINRRK